MCSSRLDSNTCSFELIEFEIIESCVNDDSDHKKKILFPARKLFYYRSIYLFFFEQCKMNSSREKSPSNAETRESIVSTGNNLEKYRLNIDTNEGERDNIKD